MLMASEPTPPGGVAGPFTKEYVPVLLVGSNAHGPLGAISPLPTTVVFVTTAPAGATPVNATPAIAASIPIIASKAPALLRIRKVLSTLFPLHFSRRGSTRAPKLANVCA